VIASNTDGSKDESLLCLSWSR